MVGDFEFACKYLSRNSIFCVVLHTIFKVAQSKALALLAIDTES